MSQPNWWYCKNCEELFFAGNGSGACPNGGGHDNSASSEYALETSGAGQTGWRWCYRCAGLFFTGASASVCPAHNPTGPTYVLASSGAGQSGWKWCNRCQGLFFAGSGASGVCPAGGGHNSAGSGTYVLPQALDILPGWRWCNKCQGLFSAGTAESGPTGPVQDLGVCPAGGTHSDTGSGGYDPATSGSGQSGWKFCVQCAGLFYGVNSLGVCPGRQPHSDSGSADYVLSSSGTGQPGWKWCNRCQGLYFPGSDNPSSGVCPAGGPHNDSGSGDYVLGPPPPPPPPTIPLAPSDLQPPNGATGVSQNTSLFFVDPGAGTPAAAAQFEYFLSQNNELLNSPPASGPAITASPLPATGVTWPWGSLPDGEVTLTVQSQNAAGTGPAATSTFTVGSGPPFTISVTLLAPSSSNNFSVQGTGFTPHGQVLLQASSSISDNYTKQTLTADGNGNFNKILPCQGVCAVAGGGQLQFSATDQTTHRNSNLVLTECG